MPPDCIKDSPLITYSPTCDLYYIIRSNGDKTSLFELPFEDEVDALQVCNNLNSAAVNANLPYNYVVATKTETYTSI